jgi:uncharacterized damage-inducible protein DinB
MTDTRQVVERDDLLRMLDQSLWANRVWIEHVYGQADAEAPRLEANRATCLDLVATRLDEVIDFTRASGESYHARVRDVLLHLVTHGYHHRGQLASHYARKGVPYPSTDHIDWLIQNRL